MEVRWYGCDDGGSRGGVEDEARGPVDRIDRVAGRVSELGRKTSRKSFPVAGSDGGGGGELAGKKREHVDQKRNFCKIMVRDSFGLVNE
ncbi:hypothetical protein Tco_0358592 [Tanacetum coccineum]